MSGKRRPKRALRKYEFNPDYKVHPGETLAETLGELGLTYGDFAGIIVSRDPFTPEMARLAERVTGVPADFWLRAQWNYDHLPGTPYEEPGS